MHPTLEPGERVLFDRLAYRNRSPKRNEIALADHPLKKGFTLIKRVVAIPGDRVDIQDNAVLVNGALCTPVRAQIDYPAGDSQWDLLSDYYFLMGDNPVRSTDSRQLGPFPVDLIKAKAWLVYWPLSRWRVLN